MHARSLIPCVVLALAAAGCGASEDPTANASSTVTAAELAEARAVTGLVKARCATCHTAGRDEIRRWGEAMRAVEAACLAPTLALTPVERVACLRSDPSDPASAFTESKLGFYALATRHTALRELFTAAGGVALHEELARDASMPPLAASTPRFDEAEASRLQRWVLGGMTGLDEAMTDIGTTACVPKRSPALLAHIAEMKATGWAARHADASLPMHGCPPGAPATACLSGHPDVTAAWGASGVTQTLRRIYELPFSTYAWTRSSADGRFSGFGGTPARIVDLGAPGGPRPITVAAEFDPAFLPDNSGFSFAAKSGARVHACRQSVLLGATAMANPSIALTEPGCASMTSADYQAIGASLDGSVFLMASGTHENDVTFSLTHGPLSGAFGAGATTNILPMLSDGVSFVERARITIAHPLEGDGGLSPSSRLLYTRFGRVAGQRGFKIRKLTTRGSASPASGEAALSIDTEEVATICASGGKAMGSFDERFLVTHQYVDPADGPVGPGGVTKDSANIVLFDLLTGETIRLTSLARGQYAFSPVFRADGWIYFLVRDANTRQETLVASDAAIRRE